MAMEKFVDLYGNGIECEIWRVANIQLFRDRVLLAVAGWLTKKHYKDDLPKVNHIIAKQYFVLDCVGQEEQKDENGDIVVPYKEGSTAFTDHFSDAVLKGNISPLVSAYNYFLTLPEFKGAKLYDHTAEEEEAIKKRNVS